MNHTQDLFAGMEYCTSSARKRPDVLEVASSFLLTIRKKRKVERTSTIDSLNIKRSDTAAPTPFFDSTPTARRARE